MALKTRHSVMVGAGLLFTPMLALAQTQHEGIPPHVVVLGAIGMLFTLGVIAVVFHFIGRVERARLDVIERLLAQDKRVPPELFNRTNELPLDVRRRRDFRRGITLLAWGLGIGLVFFILSHGQWRAAAWSLIFLFLSGASFLNWYLSERFETHQERTHGA